MLKTMPIGTYYEGSSILHRLQARTKLIVLIAIATWLMIANGREWHFAPILATLALLLTSIALSGLSPRVFWQRLRLLVIFTLIGSVPTLFTREGNDRPFVVLGPAHIAYGLLRQSAIFLGVFLVFFLLVSFLLARYLPAWLRRQRILPLFLLIALLAYLWFTNGTSSIASTLIGPFNITYQGVWTVTDIYVALLALFTFSLLVTMTTTPVALIEGLTLLLAPLRRLKLPVDDFALMALLSLRFIATLTEEAEQLMKAQTARGADIAYGPIRERLHSLVMLFVPLMQSILRRAAELGTALEARGYKVDGRQTMLYETSLTSIDYGVLALFALVIVGTLLL
jgi:energy-coupling factor transport system permease protein